MTEQVMIYEVKSSAVDNAKVLFSEDRQHFYWNDAKFTMLTEGDLVYVVNSHENLVLLTTFHEERIPTEKNEQNLTATFADRGKSFTVEAPSVKKLNEWSHFIRLTIQKIFNTPKDWDWKSLGSAENSYLNGNRIDPTNNNRVKNIEQLSDLSNDPKHQKILGKCMKNFEKSSLHSEIVEAAQRETIKSLLQEEEFYFQKAVDVLDIFHKFDEPKDGFYESIKKQYDLSSEKYLEFVETHRSDSKEYTFLNVLGELISYLDVRASDKNHFNQYEDKRALAGAYVRQTAWVKNLIDYKISDHDEDLLSPNILNAVRYLKDPEYEITMLSENHREMVANNLFNKGYRKETFIETLLEFFKPYEIKPKNRLNYTYIISQILYRFDDVKSLWYEKEEPDVDDISKAHLNEKQIINHIHAYLTSIGFRYSFEEIANFYLSLRTKPFVILAGISGTGKTQLPRKLGEALGFEDKQVRLVPVRPDWTDSSDLLGYTSLNDVFVPKDLTLVIKEANSAPEKPFLFILDEMNLARVEHYFSDYLSTIETRERDGERIITKPILRKETLQGAKNAENFSELCWPDNLYLVGTVNMDETTFTFSRKVLDRANTIEMNEINLDWMETTEEDVSPLSDINNRLFKSRFLSPMEFSTKHKESIAGDIELLKSINNILKQADLHFAYRVRDEIAYYLVMNKSLELMDAVEALDFQIVQKILPRIHGSSDRIHRVLIELLNLLEKKGFSVHTFEYRNIEGELDEEDFRYKRSSKKIAFMLKRFDEDRFTSFWL